MEYTARLLNESNMKNSTKLFIRRNAILIIILILGIVWTFTVRAIAYRNAYEVAEAEYAAKLEAYKADQARQKQAEYFMSGEASREAFINQEIDAAARLAAKMDSDVQKGGIICNALARVMSKSYPDTMQEVIAQPEQWMFYSADNPITEHDREIADKILRPYYEQGVIPTGLSEDFVYGSWSQSDYVLRNTWDFSSSTRTWRYPG